MEKKRTIVQVLICVGLLCVIWGGYFFASKYGINRILDIKGNDFSWVYQVDSVDMQEKKCVIKGFAFELNTDAKKEAFEIVLQDMESEKKYFLKMEYNKREDVNEYFLCEYDYVDSGFSASINKKIVNGRNYEILLRVAGQKDACLKFSSKKSNLVSTFSFCRSDAINNAFTLGWVAERDITTMCKDSWRWQSMNPEGYKGSGK